MKIASPHLMTNISSFVKEKKKKVHMYFRDNFCSEAQYRNFMNSSKGYEVKMVGLQNGDTDLIGRKFGYTNDELLVRNTKTLAKDGSAYSERLETYYPTLTKGLARSHYFGRNSTFLIDYGLSYDKGFSDTDENLKEVFQITNDGFNPFIIHTRRSDVMPGHYEIEKYDLNNYPPDIDIISEIKEGRVFPNKFLSRIRKTKNGQKCEENYYYNSLATHKVDSFGQSLGARSSRRSYRILDKDGNKILDLNRSFVETPTMSLTKINGRKYFSYFDDYSKKITILSNDKIVGTFDLNSVYYSISKQPENAKEKLWKMLKSCPADVLLDTSKYLKTISCMPDRSDYCCAFVEDGKIKTSARTSCYGHELGHLVTLSNDFELDQDLLDTIEEEQKLLRDNFPNQYRASFDYLSTLVPESSSYSGVDELLAETYLILKGFDQSDELGYRTQMIVQYFPKTVAKIAQMLDNLPQEN